MHSADTQVRLCRAKILSAWECLYCKKFSNAQLSSVDDSPVRSASHITAICSCVQKNISFCQTVQFSPHGAHQQMYVCIRIVFKHLEFSFLHKKCLPWTYHLLSLYHDLAIEAMQCNQTLRRVRVTIPSIPCSYQHCCCLPFSTVQLPALLLPSLQHSAVTSTVAAFPSAPCSYQHCCCLSFSTVQLPALMSSPFAILFPFICHSWTTFVFLNFWTCDV